MREKCGERERERIGYELERDQTGPQVCGSLRGAAASLFHVSGAAGLAGAKGHREGHKSCRLWGLWTEGKLALCVISGRQRQSYSSNLVWFSLLLQAWRFVLTCLTPQTLWEPHFWGNYTEIKGQKGNRTQARAVVSGIPVWSLTLRFVPLFEDLACNPFTCSTWQ